MRAMAAVTRFFHPVLRARDLRDRPVQVRLDGERYALWRGADGSLGAVVDRCPHRFAPLSAGEVRSDGRLACPYHGWRFDRDGRGQSPSQPGLSRCDVRAMQAVERYGAIWIADRDVPLDRLPNIERPGFEHAGVFVEQFMCPLHVALDNFSEDEHTPWVHTRLGWLERDTPILDFAAENHDDRTEVRYRAIQRPSQLSRFFGIRPGDHFHNEWVTRFDPVRSEYLISWTDPSGETQRPAQLLAPIFMTPQDAQSTLFVVFMLAKLDAPYLRRLRPLVHRGATALIRREIRDDAVFVPNVADTPFAMKGMRLGRFDKPLIHNHRLLERLYWGESYDEHSARLRERAAGPNQ
ncbi:MAG: Rieske 2Fe-2S domain-containing protein [Myxococcales bacterium]|nr:Rieske 2Fe-2S domain-containing protein [Myxococcales bacterium]